MDKKKNGFASGLGFVLAAAGSAVGLGNLWGFPYKTHDYGGAAFVLVYIACVLFIGFVTMVCEIFIGRRAQANPVTAFKKISPKVGWFGVLAVIIPGFIACYYSVLGGYTVRFTANSLIGNAGTFAPFAGSIWQVILFSALFIGTALFIVMAGVKGGIEKASKILMPVLFVILVSTAIFSLCLGEGVKEGLEFYLKPDFSKLSGTGILAAMGQAFYSLSLGMGAMIAYGSYTGKEINLLKATGMICLCDTCVALLAGFAIFPAVYHFTATTGAAAGSFQGVGLMFQTLPLVFESLGFVGKIISFFFFAMVFIAAVTSVISLLEVVSQFVIQKFRVSRKKAVSVLALICFAVSIPVGISLGQALNGREGIVVFGQNLLDFFDIVTNTVLMPVCAFLSCFAIGWLIGPKKACREMEEDGQRLGWFRSVFYVMVRFVTPALIAIIEVFGVYDLVFPAVEGIRSFHANGLGIALSAYGLLAVGVVVYFLFFKKKDTGCNEDEAALEEK
ncbi:MAG: sodium-dependent transporter [Clostridia bacterium]|nr:sodium-dependent transporter [Clostridia bacterium]